MNFAKYQNKRMDKLSIAFLSYMHEAFPKISSQISKEEDDKNLDAIKHLTGNFTPWFIYQKKDKSKVIFTKNYNENYNFNIPCNKDNWGLLSNYESKNEGTTPCKDDIIYSTIYLVGDNEKECKKIDYQILAEPCARKDSDIVSFFANGTEQTENISVLSLIETFLKLWIGLEMTRRA